MSERDYERGYKAAWDYVLAVALRNLPQRTNDKHQWRRERAAAVAALRHVCEDHGDNDWPDTLHLGDVIEKHLHRHLEAK